jgi:hypothetical protein
MTLLNTSNTGQNLGSTIAASSATFGAITSGINTIGSMFDSAGNFNPRLQGGILNAIGNTAGDIASAVSMFSDNADPNDWRVRLSLPNWISFRTSPVLKPLQDAGGLIFPYTPTINIKSDANYSAEPITHNNYSVTSYRNSVPGEISINAPMNVEDATQATYWIAAVHYLRSVTKMFSGNDPKAGNPPPLVYLNGYGNYVFKNVPVVVTRFECQLGNDCDYIGVNVVGNIASVVSGVSDSLGGLASTLGGAVSGLSGITSTISNIAGGVGQVSNLLGAYNVGGTTSGGRTYVPTKSSFSISLRPVYSRTSIKNFSLDTFVSGGYLLNYYGYV